MHQPEYGILKDAAGVAAKVFFESAGYAGLPDDCGYIRPTGSVTAVQTSAVEMSNKDGEKDVIREQEPGRGASTGQTTRLKLAEVRLETPPELAELFREEIPLENDQVMYIFGPRRILRGDKVRIK